MWQRRETKTPLEAMAGVAKYVAGVAKSVAGVHFRAPVQRNPWKALKTSRNHVKPRLKPRGRCGKPLKPDNFKEKFNN